MANIIILKKSSIPGKVPTADDLQVGELAVNLVDQKLYSKKADGTIVRVGSGSYAASEVSYDGATSGLTATDVQAAIDEVAESAVNVEAESVKIDGDLEFVGQGRKITGDFSSTPVSNRVVVQTNILDGLTALAIIPNGAGKIAQVFCTNSSDVSSPYQMAQCVALEDQVSFRSGISGGASYLPMTFYTGGAERLRLQTDGRLNIVDGTAASPAINFASDPDTGMYRQGSDAIGFATGGVERMRVTTGGLRSMDCSPALRLRRARRMPLLAG